MIVKDEYYKVKKKAMLFNRGKKVENLQKQMAALSKSETPGTWDIAHLKNGNQLPPPDEISLDLPY